mgnify:CR=1 FL=1
MKRLFKKVVAVATVMAMCMSMVACSEEAATSESSGGGSSSSSSSGDTIKLGFGIGFIRKQLFYRNGTNCK